MIMMIAAIAMAYNASWGKPIGFVVGPGGTVGEAEGRGDCDGDGVGVDGVGVEVDISPSVMVLVLLHPLSSP